MAISRKFVAALLLISCWLILAGPLPAPAGTFKIIFNGYVLGTDHGGSRMVGSNSRARYYGAVDWDDDHWQIGASVKPEGSSWYDGSPNYGGNITPNMVIFCSWTSCGGNAIIDKCTTSGTDNGFEYKGAVAISHSQSSNETDVALGFGHLTCPVSPPELPPRDPEDNGCYDDCGTSPILIDVERDHYQLTGLSDAVTFDIDGDGDEEVLGWTEATSDDAFLALDRNVNGIIDSGRELFGDSTEQPPSESPNGFAALAVLDRPEYGGNEDGKITDADLAFYQLLLWTDRNHDAYSQGSEIEPLSTSAIEAIELNYVENGQADQHGNWLRWKSKVHFQQGRRFAAVDVIFVTEE